MLVNQYYSWILFLVLPFYHWNQTGIHCQFLLCLNLSTLYFQFIPFVASEMTSLEHQCDHVLPVPEPFHGFLLPNCKVIKVPGTWQLFTFQVSFPIILLHIPYNLTLSWIYQVSLTSVLLQMLFSCPKTTSPSTSCPHTEKLSLMLLLLKSTQTLLLLQGLLWLTVKL